MLSNKFQLFCSSRSPSVSMRDSPLRLCPSFCFRSCIFFCRRFVMNPFCPSQLSRKEDLLLWIPPPDSFLLLCFEPAPIRYYSIRFPSPSFSLDTRFFLILVFIPSEVSSLSLPLSLSASLPCLPSLPSLPYLLSLPSLSFKEDLFCLCSLSISLLRSISFSKFSFSLLQYSLLKTGFFSRMSCIYPPMSSRLISARSLGLWWSRWE